QSAPPCHRVPRCHRAPWALLQWRLADWQDMLLWLLFAMLTAVALAVLLVPLASAPRAGGRAAVGPLAVYRHQLEEIEAERELGWVSEAEAVAAAGDGFAPPPP